MKKLKIFEMFAGYGGASFALKKAQIPFECVGYSEIDKYAIQCWEQNHQHYFKSEEFKDLEKTPLINNFGDATKINPKELKDFDLLTGGFPCQSFSTAGKGKGELDTRGTLFNDIIRVAEVKKPRYMLLENVKGLTTKKHKETFNKILLELKRMGYYVHWKVLNSKDFSIPQNRERVFFVCFRELEDYTCFEFPEKELLNKSYFDLLELNVEDKYYLSERALKGIKNTNFHSHKKRVQKKSVCSTLLARDFKDPKCTWCASKQNLRRLTPREYFRLMGFKDYEINLKDLSNTQKYKLAGNGWDINLVSKILKKMLKYNYTYN